VLSARNTHLAMQEEIFLAELHLPSCGMIFPYVNGKYNTLGTSGCYSRLSCSSFHQNTQTNTLLGKILNVTRRITSGSQRNENIFVPRSARALIGYTQRLLSIPYSVRLLSSRKWTAAFRNTRNCGLPWRTQKGHLFLQRFSGGKNTTRFLHRT
jgi:hypothetical protein